MVDWVSLTISIFALLVSSALGIISLRISWKNLITQFGPYLILKEISSETKKVVIENKGNGMAYNTKITIWDNKGRLFRVMPMIAHLEINESREMDFDWAMPDEYLKDKKKGYDNLENIAIIRIRCFDIHNSFKDFYYEFVDLDERIITQKFLPIGKKQFNDMKKFLRNNN